MGDHVFFLTGVITFISLFCGDGGPLLFLKPSSVLIRTACWLKPPQYLQIRRAQYPYASLPC